VEALSTQKPVLMIFEDAHWADPTSLEAFSRAVDRIRTHGVLLIVTYRPEFEPPWIGRPHVAALTLNRLGERDIAAMIDGVTGNKSLPSSPPLRQRGAWGIRARPARPSIFQNLAAAPPLRARLRDSAGGFALLGRNRFGGLRCVSAFGIQGPIPPRAANARRAAAQSASGPHTKRTPA
jgi:hypothetical protein